MKNMVRIEEVVIGMTAYCPYCAEKAVKDSDGSYHNNDYEEFYVCGCSVAIEAQKMEDEISKLRAKIYHLKTDWDVKNKLKEIEYNYELDCLNRKFSSLKVRYGKDVQ